MYRALCAAFDSADADENVILTVITGCFAWFISNVPLGTGLYFSAGSDFSPSEMSAEAE